MPQQCWEVVDVLSVCWHIRCGTDNVNDNTQYLSPCKSCKQSYDGCAMRVVFSRLQNCPGFSDDDFKDGGSAFQHMGPKTAKAREPYVTVLVCGKSRQVFSCHLKVCSVISGLRKAARRLFHRYGTAIAKLHRPIMVRALRTCSRSIEADLRW